MRRVVIVGSTGSGKSTLARAMADRLGLPYFETDALHWNPGWVATPRPEFRGKVEAATEGEAWVTEGNYSGVRDILLTRADTLVWLDYSFPLVFYRLLGRTVARIADRRPICNGNYETFRDAFLSKNSPLLYLAQTYRRKRREFGRLGREYPHLAVFHLRNPEQASRWLEGLVT